MNLVTTSKNLTELFTEIQLAQFYKLFSLKIYKNDDIVFGPYSNKNKIVLILEGNLINVLIYIIIV